MIPDFDLPRWTVLKQPPTGILRGNIEWLHSVSGEGDHYMISLNYEQEPAEWRLQVSSSDGWSLIADLEHAEAVLHSFIWHHFRNMKTFPVQVKPGVFTQNFSKEILSGQSPFPCSNL